MNMKTIRRLLALSFLVVGVAACGTSPTAPDCEDPTQCDYIPDSGSFDDGYIPDSGS